MIFSEKEVKVEIPAEVEKLLTDRGLKREDVIEAVISAEKTGEKLFLPRENIFLAKKVIGPLTVYAIYSVTDNVATVRTAYSHKMKLLEVRVKITKEVQEWECFLCKEKTVRATVDMEYLGIVRAGTALVCPECERAYIEEDIATRAIAGAEQLFEKKRA